MKKFNVDVEWCADDIRALYPNLTIDEAEIILLELQSELHETALAAGWEIIKQIKPDEFLSGRQR